MKKVTKKHCKVILGIIVGIIISTTVTYGAENILTGSDVSYNNKNSSSNNIQKAIDELKEKTNSCSKNNKNIVSAYSYSESGDNTCITGDESTCQETECYKTKTKDSCKAGDIITYKVNDNTEVKFHVMFDEGDYITLQSQTNTLESAWYSDQDNRYGPKNALSNLKNQTNNWYNVRDLTYKLGNTNFSNKGNDTGCNATNNMVVCGYYNYTLPKIAAKARMITIQEAKSFGCSYSSNSNTVCPKWMYNYVSKCNYDNCQYWTMTAKEDSYTSQYAWSIDYKGYLYFNSKCNKNLGVRAVVEINK